MSDMGHFVADNPYIASLPFALMGLVFYMLDNLKEREQLTRHIRMDTVWQALFGWAVLSTIAVVLIGVGWNVMSAVPPDARTARVCFSLAALIILGKSAAWLYGTDASGFNKVFAACLILGIIGSTWTWAIAWVSSRAPKLSILEQPTQNNERTLLLDSIDDFISKKDEMELRDTFDIDTVTRDAILEAKMQLTPGSETQVERDTVARDMVNGQNVFYKRYVRMSGNNISPLPGKSEILHLTPKAIQARKQLAVFSSSALTPTDVANALNELEKAIADNQEILMDTINESYGANPATISKAFSCPTQECMAVNNLFYSRFIQLEPKAAAITSGMRKYMERHQP
ncbi:MAG: hypothetical protein ACRD3B_10280 [Candidatus Sulfotelmatobacter sp.]